jgi:hypothetical protein
MAEDEKPREEDEGYERELQAQKRHEENIQILVALGILGGYITLLSGDCLLGDWLSELISFEGITAPK